MEISLIGSFIKRYKNLDNVSLYYILFQTFFSLLLWIPIFFVFQIESGLTTDKIFFIQSLYYLAFCIFELPTGALADKIGHKSAMALGAFVLMVSNLVPVFFAHYFGFLVHFLLIAAARSLISGSTSSYLFNYLKRKNESENYKIIEGKARSLGLVVRVIVWPMAGPLMTYVASLPYIITSINSGIALICALKLPNDKAYQSEDESSNSWDIRELYTQIIQSKKLMFFMVQGAGIFVLQRLCMVQLYQPLLKHQEFSLTSFGLMMSLSTVFESIGAYKGYHFKKYFKDETTVFVMTLITALCFLIMILPSQIMTVIGFSLFSLCAGIAFPVQKQLLNDHILESKYRASILSVESLGDRVLCSIASVLIGLSFKADISIPLIFVSFSILALIFLSSLLLVQKKLFSR